MTNNQIIKQALKDGHIDHAPKTPTKDMVEAYIREDETAFLYACATSPEWGEVTIHDATLLTESYLSTIETLKPLYA